VHQLPRRQRSPLPANPYSNDPATPTGPAARPCRTDQQRAAATQTSAATDPDQTESTIAPIRQVHAALYFHAQLTIRCRTSAPARTATPPQGEALDPEDAWQRLAAARGLAVPDTDQQRQWLQHLARHGRRGGQWQDHRRVINGVLWRVRTGTPWRDLPARYGPGRPATTGLSAGAVTAPGTGYWPTPKPTPTPSANWNGSSVSTAPACAPISTPLAHADSPPARTQKGARS
jgi:hypothetical protein